MIRLIWVRLITAAARTIARNASVTAVLREFGYSDRQIAAMHQAAQDYR